LEKNFLFCIKKAKKKIVHLVGSNTDDSSILLSVFRVRESKPRAKKKELHSRHITIRHSRYSDISNIRELRKIYSHMRMDSGFEIHLAVTSARERRDTERNLSSLYALRETTTK